MRLALPAASQALGSLDGLANPVRWARRMSVYPPAFGGIEKEEIALLRVDDLCVIDEHLGLVAAIDALSERGIAGIGAVGHISREAEKRAEQCGMPLLALPDAVDLRDVERDIVRLIVDREAQLDRRGRIIYRDLAQLSIANLGFAAVADTLRLITGKSILILDAQLRVEAQALTDNCPLEAEQIRAMLPDAAVLVARFGSGVLDDRMPPAIEEQLAGICDASLVAIAVESEFRGCTVVIAAPGSLDALDRIAVERGALVCAMELAKAQAIEAAQQNAFGDFLDALLTAGGSRLGALQRRASELGHDLSHFHGVVLLATDVERISERGTIMAELRAILTKGRARVLVSAHEGGAAALCTSADCSALDSLYGLVDQARARLLQLFPASLVAAGIGRPGAGIEGFRASYAQAQESLGIALELFHGNRILSYGDLSLYHLLRRLQESDELQAFLDDTISSLSRYDTEHGTQLVETLDTFFAHLGNASQTAEALFLHRNSLQYRLERIKEITGMDLNDSGSRFSMQLALKLAPLAPSR